MRQIEARILNRLEDMPRVAGMVSRFGGKNGLVSSFVHDLNIVVDEALSNIIAYGYPPDTTSEIMIRLEYLAGEVTVTIEDRGQPFDPLQIPPPDLTAPLHGRKVGGLGVHFMRSLMDSVIYTRIDGTNRLRLTKKTAA